MNFLTNNESQNTEYKEKFTDGVFKTLSAFANTNGGVVFVGIADNKEIIGIEYSPEEIKKITEQIVNKLGVHPSIEYFETEGNNILKIEVKKSSMPVSYNGKYYDRVGNTTREMQGEKLKAFFIKGTNWDALAGDYSIEEIDETTVKRFTRMAVNSGRLKAFDTTDSVSQVLERLKLIVDGKITNAAIILFGKDPQKHFINALTRVGRFKTESTIIGDRRIEGNLFKQIDEAEESIKNFINVRYEIKGKLQREDIWDYPLEAIREALLNALIHRDYFKCNVQTQIKVFDDYIWYFNIGGLADGITMEQLKTAHPSVTRNPLILHVLYLAGFVEEYGSGIQRMINAFKDASLPEPEFKEEFGGFVVYFRKSTPTGQQVTKIELSERQNQVIQYIKDKGSITNKELQEISSISKLIASRELSKLVKKGIIKKIGTTGKGTKYVLP
ncbi:MAG TPA: transcriptional regulator [Cyanobacteria bacterium UBA9971]|nr:transcriptional regulator [Cyanobacteria bacterium UBA9971]